MTKSTTPSPVSIHPSSFTEPSINELTAGDVIKMYQVQESKRKRGDENYEQSDVPIPFRSVPDGLLETLDEVVNTIGLRKPVITRCLSHHAMAWYQSLPQVSLLSQLYKTVHTRSDGFPDIIRRVQRDDYEFLHARPAGGSVGVLRTVSFILGYFSDLSAMLGIPTYKLFLSGLCWSLATNTEGWAANTVSKFLRPESQNMLVYLGERLLVLDYADKLVRLRQGDADVLEYVKGLGGR